MSNQDKINDIINACDVIKSRIGLVVDDLNDYNKIQDFILNLPFVKKAIHNKDITTEEKETQTNPDYYENFPLIDIKQFTEADEERHASIAELDVQNDVKTTIKVLDLEDLKNIEFTVLDKERKDKILNIQKPEEDPEEEKEAQSSKMTSEPGFLQSKNPLNIEEEPEEEKEKVEEEKENIEEEPEEDKEKVEEEEQEPEEEEEGMYEYEYKGTRYYITDENELNSDIYKIDVDENGDESVGKIVGNLKNGKPRFQK
jgi:hypothetical protein